MRHYLGVFKRLFDRQDGASIVEYALLVGLIAVSLVAIISYSGTLVRTFLSLP